MKENINIITFAFCITIVVVSLIGSIGYYNINERRLLSTNISEAVAKGVDPIAVRCSYASGMDTMCIAYAASTKK